MPFLYERIKANQVLLTIPQHILANASKTRYFADTLLRFLVERLEALGDPNDKIVSSVMVRCLPTAAATAPGGGHPLLTHRATWCLCAGRDVPRVRCACSSWCLGR